MNADGATPIKLECRAGVPGSAGAGFLPPAPVSFTIPTPPSVNDIYKNVQGKGRVKSHGYDKFIAHAITTIRLQNVPPISGRVVMIAGVERMSLQADLDNRLKAMQDAIVKAGVIMDDNLITAIAIAWLPKANGLSHIRLVPASRLSLTFHPSKDASVGGWYSEASQEEEETDDLSSIA